MFEISESDLWDYSTANEWSNAARTAELYDAVIWQHHGLQFGLQFGLPFGQYVGAALSH